MMRLRNIIIFPIISVIGISLAIHICGSLLIDFIICPFKRKPNSVNGQKSDTTMWRCRKCTKPVYFAERKSSLGYDWHPQCLTCEECGKRLNPGQHAEHKGIPYCYIPCYGALFGPTLYGHGSRVESHSSFGKSKVNTESIDKTLEVKLKEYNQFYEGKSNVIHYRERNGKLILEGSIKIYWDVSNVILLKEDNDDRVFIRKRSYKSPRHLQPSESAECTRNAIECTRNAIECTDSTSSDDFSSPDHEDDGLGRNYKTLPIGGLKNRKLKNVKTESKSFDDEYVQQITDAKSNKNQPEDDTSDVTLRRNAKVRRSRVKLKRRCSINGHFYNRETSVFTPAHGSVTSVWISSLVNTFEVINMLLDKFKVTNIPEDFALFVVRDNGECKRIQDNENPLVTRVMLGPNEDAAKVFILNKNKHEISSEVAQYLQLSNIELQTFLRKFEEEEIREVIRIKKKYCDVKKWIKLRIKELSV